MIYSPSSHPRCIWLFFLSDECSQSYIKKCPSSFKL